MDADKFTEILKYDTELTQSIETTNSEYNELIRKANLLQKAKTIDFIKIIRPIKYQYLDENGNNIISDLKDQYIFIGDFAYEQSYDINKKYHNNKYCGKWMLFGSLDELVGHWDTIKQKTISGELGFFSKFVGDENNRLICVYFEDYRNEDMMLAYGNKIKEMTEYQYPMFFKSNRMTTKKQYGWGSWIYKIDGEEYEFV